MNALRDGVVYQVYPRSFSARIDVLEAMGSELYAHFSVTSEQQIESAELRELAEDAGADEVPSSGREGRIMARGGRRPARRGWPAANGRQCAFRSAASAFSVCHQRLWVTGRGP